MKLILQNVTGQRKKTLPKSSKNEQSQNLCSKILQQIFPILLLIFFFPNINHAQNAFKFDGNAYLECETAEQSDFVTVEAWIKPENFTYYSGIAGFIEWSNPDYDGYMLYIHQNGVLGGAVGRGSMIYENSPTNTLIANEWQHVAMTYDGDSLKVYLNAELVALDGASSTKVISYTDVTGKFQIGRFKDSDQTYPFEGMIDEVRVWDYARTQQQLADNMNAEVCQNEEGLKMYYSMNCTEMQGEEMTGNYHVEVHNVTSESGVDLTSVSGCEPSLCNKGEPISIASSVDLENFSANYGCNCGITGDLYISSSHNQPPLENLDTLARITRINGKLQFYNIGTMEDASGMSNIEFIGGDLRITQNERLKILPNLEAINSLGGYLYIVNNDSLTYLPEFSNLTTIAGELRITSNPELLNIPEFPNLMSVEGDFYMAANPKVESLNGFNNLTTVNGNFSIYNNFTSVIGFSALTEVDNFTVSTGGAESISTFENLVTVNGHFHFSNNSELTSFIGFPALRTIGGNFNFSSNSKLEGILNFSDIESFGGDIVIGYNRKITEIIGFDDLTSIEGNLLFEYNSDLISIPEFPNVTAINGHLKINGNKISSLNGFDVLETVQGKFELANFNLSSIPEFSTLQSVGEGLNISRTNLSTIMGFNNLTDPGSIRIYYNIYLTDISGLSNVDNISSLNIAHNTNLSDCHIASVCSYLEDENNSASIFANKAGCDTRTAIEDNCALGIIVLSVDLERFEARPQGKDARLHWQTAAERNNAGFEIQHSHNGHTWQTIDFVEGKGNSTERNDYAYLHQSPGGGKQFYRLMQMDFDGKYEFSEIRTVDFSGADTAMVLSPNPAQEDANISLNIQSKDFVSGSVVIFDTSGKIVFQQSINDANSSIRIANLQAGIYFVELKIDENVSVFEKLLIRK